VIAIRDVVDVRALNILFWNSSTFSQIWSCWLTSTTILRLARGAHYSLSSHSAKWWVKR